MAVIIKSVKNLLTGTIILSVPGINPDKVVTLPYNVTVNLLSVLDLNELETMQGELSGLVSRGTLASMATVDTDTVGEDDAVHLAGNESLAGVKSFTGSIDQSETFSGTGSHQGIASDETLAAAAGSNTGSNPKFLAAMMGNLLGNSLTRAANYLGGLIGFFSVTGAKATTYPAGAVLAGIADGVTQVDGAVVAFIDGDSSVTTANAAFKAMANNSNVGSGFNYGVDLHGPAHDGYNTLAILKADVRLSHEVCMLNGAGAPVDGTTGATFAEIGSIYIDRTNGNAYINAGTKASPTWKLITRAA